MTVIWQPTRQDTDYIEDVDYYAQDEDGRRRSTRENCDSIPRQAAGIASTCPGTICGGGSAGTGTVADNPEHDLPKNILL